MRKLIFWYRKVYSVYHCENCTLRLLPKAIFLIFSIFYFAGLFSAEAAPVVSSEELFKDAEKYDGKAIIYKGEVIGDIMIRQESAWINVRDEGGALGVFCPQELVEKIEHTGSYKFSGDRISVWGTFYHSCPKHGGDTDIHAEKITIIEKGEALAHPLEPRRVKASIILPAIVLALAIIHLIVRRLR